MPESLWYNVDEEIVGLWGILPPEWHFLVLCTANITTEKIVSTEKFHRVEDSTETWQSDVICILDDISEQKKKNLIKTNDIQMK